jgi:hypothetical protein
MKSQSEARDTRSLGQRKGSGNWAAVQNAGSAYVGNEVRQVMVFEVVREGLTKLETRSWKPEAENKN